MAWTALFLAIAVIGLWASDGQPVCEGPFITRVDDSLPPQCPSPVEVLPALGVVWLVGLAVIIGSRAIVRSLRPD